jgi:hypothetical protein
MARAALPPAPSLRNQLNGTSFGTGSWDPEPSSIWMRFLPGLFPKVEVCEVLWQVRAEVPRKVRIVGFPQEHCPVFFCRTLDLSDVILDGLFQKVVLNSSHVVDECRGVDVPWILLRLLTGGCTRDTVQNIKASTKVVSDIG